MSEQKIKLNSEIMKRIHKLIFDINEEIGYAYSVEDIINMALTALEDIREG